MSARSIHAAGGAHVHAVWDNAIEPALEVDPGAEVTLEALDASGGQLDASSRAAGELARTEAGGYHVTTGVARDLMGAARDATRAAVEHIARRRGGDEQEAYALASVACDLRIHEVVDAPNRVVGCFIPDALLSPR